MVRRLAGFGMRRLNRLNNTPFTQMLVTPKKLAVANALQRGGFGARRLVRWAMDVPAYPKLD